MQVVYDNYPTIYDYHNNRNKDPQHVLLHPDNKSIKPLIDDLSTSIVDIENNYDDKYIVKSDPQSGIYVILNKNQLRRIRNHGNQDFRNDFNIYLADYIEDLYDAYGIYGKYGNDTNGNPLFRRLDDINGMSKFYTQAPIMEPEYIYPAFEKLQYTTLSSFFESDIPEHVDKRNYFLQLITDYKNEFYSENKHSWNHIVSSDICNKFVNEFIDNMANQDYLDKQKTLLRKYDNCTNIGEIYQEGTHVSCSFENYKLIFELREYQIKRYYMLYVIVANIYDVWEFKKNGKEISKESINANLGTLFPGYFTPNDQIINIVWNTVTSLWTSDNSVDNLCTHVMICMNRQKTKCLDDIMEKYNNDDKNFNLYMVFITHRYFKLFEKKINKTITIILKSEVNYLLHNDMGRFDVIHDPVKLRIYLQGINFVYQNINVEMITSYISTINTSENEKKKLIAVVNQNNTNYDLIERFSAKYTKDFDLKRMTVSERDICKTLNSHEKFNRLNFIQKFLLVEISTMLNIGPSKPLNIIWRAKHNPTKKDNPEFNTLCNIINDDSDNPPIAVYGMSDDTNNFIFCTSNYITQVFIFSTYNKPYELTTWTPTTNNFRLHTELTFRKKLIYARNKDKPLFPAHFIDDVSQLVKNNIDKVKTKYVYVGILVIPTNGYFTGRAGRIQKKNIIFIFWNKLTKLFEITDINGNDLQKGVILYSPYVTYHELKQIYKYYKMKYFALEQINRQIPKDIYLVQKEPPKLWNGEDAEETPMCEVRRDSFENTKIKTLAFGNKCNERTKVEHKYDN